MAGTVVFDLDGTLADTAGDLIGAANAVLARRGLDGLDPVADAPIAFEGGRAMLRAGYARASAGMLIPPQAEEQDFPLLLSAYDAAIAVHTRLYPGVEAALQRLLADGHILTVCTNKPEGLADKLLRALGIREAFSGLVGADTLPVRKPDPSPYREAVARAIENLEQAGPSTALGAGESASEELILADLADARRALEEVTGKRTTEDVLRRIFESFCIGK